MSGNSIEDLGKLMNSQMKRISKVNKDIAMEFGTISSNMSLSVSSLGNEIPKGDYMMSLHLQGSNDGLPEQLRGLKPGDRVLVAWVGTEPVVVDILVSS